MQTKATTTISYTSFDGQSLSVHHWPKAHPQAETLHWAHATGFHGRNYWPLLEPLSAHVNVMAWDMRGHGLSRDAGRLDAFKSWQVYYRDLIHMLDESEQPMWLGGHSVGGTTSLAAACARPHKVKGLFLVDPVLFGPGVGLLLQGAKLLGQADKFGLAQGAARRRAQFESPDEAYNNYRRKKAFSTWPDHWLKAYTDFGFHPRAEGGVELSCRPAWESVSFTHTEPHAWRWIKPLQCPVQVWVAEQGSTFPANNRASILKRLPTAKLSVLPGTTHFLPMEKTDVLVGEMLKHMLGK